MLENIAKRDGTIVRFEQEKITEAIWKAVKAVGGTDKNKTQELSDLALEELKKKYDGRIPTVEETQDIVEKVLIEEGHAKTAKSYITYRLSHQELREFKNIFDTIDVIDDYIGERDWTIKENSNMGYSLQGMNNHITQKVVAHYWLRKVYPEEIRKAHENADLHIHDLGCLGPYCVGWDLEDLLMTGFKGAPGKVESKPAKHLDTALGQMINFFYTLQGESAGAQAFSNFDTLLAPFVKYDNLNYKEVKQEMQKFLFNVNVPTRVGFQTPFTNITMDLEVPNHMKDKPVIVGLTKEDIEEKYQSKLNTIKEISTRWAELPYNEIVPKVLEQIVQEFQGYENSREILKLFLNTEILPKEKQSEALINGSLRLCEQERDGSMHLLNSTYGDFQKEMDIINQTFAECMLEGDATGRPFSFPIPTYNITKNFDWDDSNHTLLWEMTAKYGIPYFSNFINSDMKPEDARSMCCRLRLDQTELRKRGGGLFGSNPLTGSIGVVTINMPRLGFKSSNEKGFFEGLENLMKIAKDSLEIKRKTLERFSEEGLYPYSNFYLRNIKKRFDKYWENHFSTIGLLGMNEGVKNFMSGEDITTEKGRNFSLKVLDFMREKLGEYQEETGHIYNLEATPGEGTTYRFAKTDKERFKDIIVANLENVENGVKPYYTNSTHLPVNYTDDLFEALELQDEFQTKYTGGTVFHTFVGERLSGKSVKLLVRKIAENFKLPYFTLTPTFSICPEDGYVSGEHERCPSCNSKCDVYSRTVGYIRPVEQWHEGKQAEFPDRKMYKVN